MYNTIEIKSPIAAQTKETLADVQTVYAELWDSVNHKPTGGPAT